MNITFVRKTLITAAAIAAIVPMVAFADTLNVGGADTGGADSSSGLTGTVTTPPNTAGQNTGGADTSSGLNVSGTNVGGADTSTTGSTLNTAGQNVGGADTSVTNSTSNSNTSTVSSGGGSGPTSSFGGSATFTYGGSSASAGVAANTNTSSSCPLITSFMKIGGFNDSLDVLKLQAFLKAQGFGVSLTGTFDAQTEAGVKSFQTAHLSEVMGPWGATQGSGMVYITTLKEINKIACGQPLALDASEMAIIDAYKQNAGSNGSSMMIGDSSGQNVPVIGSAQSQTTTVTSANASSASATSQDGMIGQNSNTDESVAAVGNANALQRFWSFLSGLFK